MNMKKILIVALCLLSYYSYAQPGSQSISVLRTRVNDSTTVNGATASGYGYLYYNNDPSSGLTTANKWKIWDGTAEVPLATMFSAGGNFWKDAGTTTISGNVDIDGGAFDVVITNANGSSVGIDPTGSSFINGNFGDSQISANADGSDVLTANKITLTAVDSINFTAPIVLLGGQVGTTGQVPTINASGKLKYATPSGGGSNIYNADGTLTANRTLTGGGFNLTMSGMASFVTDATGDMNFTSSAGSITTQSATIAITDAATMDIAEGKNTLTTSSATRTFTQSFNGDYAVIILTLNTTSCVFTFPAGALCLYNGVDSGDNTLTVTGVSGDKHIISILKNGTDYYVAGSKFGQ